MAIDLLFRGYEVFRSVSPSCSCDLAILKDGRLLKVEVRTGKYSTGGKVFTNFKNVRAEILAIVLHDRLIYQPSIDE